MSLFSFLCALAGGNCTDGFTVLPLIKGSTWQIASGIWALAGCPAGYYLAIVCQPCPSFFYCTGGSLPSTSCASGQYSLPRATSEAECFAAVFVVVVINVPIIRENFVGVMEGHFQGALANAVGLSPDYVYLEIIQAGSDPRTTSVTSKIATIGTKQASAVFQGLDSGTVHAAYTSMGLGSPTLISVQETACVPGYELDSKMQACRPCPAMYYCLGGSSGKLSCPSGSFAVSGANASSACNRVVFVFVDATLPISQNNFTTYLQSKFQMVLAMTAGVPIERVVVVSGSRRSEDSQVLVNSEIAVENAASAQSVSQRIDMTSLNSNLALQGLLTCSALSVTVAGTVAQSSSGAVSLPAVLGGSVGGIGLLVAIVIAGYFLNKRIQRHLARRAFLAAMRGAKEGQTASTEHLPPDDDEKSLRLRAQYTPEVVLGKGANGSVVVRARKNHKPGERDLKKGSGGVVALKIIVPRQGTFTDEEKQKLQTEAHLLALVTAKQCKSAANADESTGPVTGIPQSPCVCWFIMEPLGPSAAAVKPIDGAACAQLARDVLAALKMVHGENWVHCNVTPTNIVRCNLGADILNKQGYGYKLIDFGSAYRTDEGTVLQVATGSPEYRAPEMFGQNIIVTKAADIWSLGVTMFELLANSLPFPLDGTDWAADTARRAPDIRNYIAAGQLQSLAPGLDRVIAKAMEKNRISRQALNLGGPFKSNFFDGIRWIHTLEV